MNFSLPRFLRRMQSSDLQTYFTARDILVSGQVEWTAKPGVLLDSLTAAIEGLPEREREPVFEDFDRVDQLSDEIGQRGYRLPVPLAPSKNPSDIALLEADLSNLFHQFDGSGRKLKIDCFERRTCDLKGAVLAQVIHYSVYIEGLPECSIEFDREEPKRRTRRPVIEAAICCEPASGILEVVSKGGSPLRKEIAQSFAVRLLNSESALMPVRSRDFDLDRLKRPMPFPTDPSDGIRSVEVVLLRLRNTADPFGCVAIDIDDAEYGDIHAKSARWFGDSDLLRRPIIRQLGADPNRHQTTTNPGSQSVSLARAQSVAEPYPIKNRLGTSN
jgi:hypothetical protein